MAKSGVVAKPATEREQVSGEEAPPRSDASAADRVAETIMSGIRSGAFIPGQHLLEPDLTRRLGISRGSLREALKQLSAAGIVTLSRFRGAYIAALDQKSVLDLLETLEPLARLAARLAAQNCGSEENKRRVQAAADAIDKASRMHNRARYLEERRAFYSTMIDIGGNRELERAMPLSRTDLFRAQVEPVQSDKQRKLHESGYSKIAKAIISGDPVAADKAVQRHFAGTRKTMIELPANTFRALDI